MNKELEIAQKAAKTAGQMVRSAHEKFEVFRKGSSYNLVTSEDTASEQSIIETIKSAFPDDSILSEESASKTPINSDRLWIIDPIDGTTNFAHHIPHYAQSIAFASKGVVMCGVVFNPASGELFYAARGCGACCNGKPIRVSAVSELCGSVIGTGFYYERGALMLRTLESIKRLLAANIQGIRRMGSAALDLCFVACGRYDGYFEYRLSPWDFAAGMLIVEEAGGICADVDGTQRGLNSKGICCSNGLIHRELGGIVISSDL